MHISARIPVIRLRLDDDKGVSPLRPPAGEPSPEPTVFSTEAGQDPLSPENIQRMTQGCDFQQQVASIGDREPKWGQEGEPIRAHFGVLVAWKVSAHDRLRNAWMR
jgi:hypothetical protein